MVKFIMAGVEMGTNVNNKSTFTIDFSDISKFFFLACSMSSYICISKTPKSLQWKSYAKKR